jgi:hypothetical protein
MKTRSRAGLVAGVLAAALLPTAPAHADVTVNLRIEGPTKTLFEGPVTTGVRPFRFTGGVAHQCDATTTGGTSPTPVPTRGAAIAEASERAPFTTAGDWFDAYGPSFTSIAGESVVFDPNTNRFLAEYKNGTPAMVGACADPISPGDDVLFAYGDLSEPLLELTGPARARLGSSVTVQVTDASTQATIAGATVGGHQTDANGKAVLGPLTTRGVNAFKATKPGAIRSNRVSVCATDGADGACGTLVASPPDTIAPLAAIDGIRDGRRFSRRHGPRELHGTTTADPSGLFAVKIRLTRKLGGTCWYFSGTRERFLKRTCGKSYAFKVADQPTWSYLLPRRLPRGRYVLETYAIDKAFNHGPADRVRFRVR